MKKDWILVIDHYEGITKKAVNVLSGYLSGLMDFVLQVKLTKDVTKEEKENGNLIVLGTSKNSILETCVEKGLVTMPVDEESFSVCVEQSPFGNGRIVAVLGYDEKGVLYGVMDLIHVYFGDVLHKTGDIWNKTYFKTLMESELPKWNITRSPAIKTRALWTWGCEIYDYKGYFENMAKLKLNEVVIWNDFAPINAKDVVSYAHSLGIKVIWGFAWGWTTECVKAFAEICNQNNLLKIQENAIKMYETQYADSGADGIYFQSFTEMSQDEVNGVSIAETVTNLVNDTASELLSRYPNLHIQFGLHATSVKNNLQAIQKVDKRIHIVWEDCGAFPYEYYPDRIDGFDETYALTEKLLSLRGNGENFGAVLKGMLKLDWQSFAHHKGSFVLGERNKEFILERQVQKDKIWRIILGGWLKNAEYFRKTIALMAEKGNNPIVQALVEDALFENEIALPVAIYAETLWSPELQVEEIISCMAKSPFVNV